MKILNELIVAQELPLIANHIYSYASEKIKNNNKYKSNMDITQLILLIHEVIAHMERCDIDLAECTDQSIIEDLIAFNEKFLKLNIVEQMSGVDELEITYEEVAADILVSCLQNNGKLITMRGRGIKFPETYLINKEYQGDKRLYKLSKSCLKYYYLISEVEGIKDIDYEAFSLIRSFNSGNYNKAELTTMKIIKKLTVADREIIDTIKSLVSDYEFFTKVANSNRVENNLEVIKSAREDINTVKTKIKEHIQKAEIDENIELTEDAKSQLEAIDNNLNRILNLMTKLQSDTLIFANKIKELEWQPFGLGIKSKISLNTDILFKIENDIEKAINVEKFIKYLSLPIRTTKGEHCNKLFNINLLFNEQEEYIQSEKNNNREKAKIETLEIDEEVSQDEYMEKNKQYVMIITTLLSIVIENGGKLELHEIIEKDSSKVLTSDIGALRNVLIFFDRKDKIKIDNIDKLDVDYMNRREEIQINNALIQIANEFNGMQSFVVVTTVEKSNELIEVISNNKDKRLLMDHKFTFSIEREN